MSSQENTQGTYVVKDWMNRVSENEFLSHEKWFLNYLGQRRLIYLPSDYHRLSLRDRISQISQGLEVSHTSNAPFVELTIKRMKAAWAQKKRRMKSPGEKPYNFFMSTKVQKSLQLLAKKHGTSINRALEALILDQEATIKRMEKQHREELKNAREASSRKRAGVGSRTDHLRTMGQNKDLQSSQPEQPQIYGKPITVDMEELGRLISGLVDQRVGEIVLHDKKPSSVTKTTEAQSTAAPKPATQPSNSGQNHIELKKNNTLDAGDSPPSKVDEPPPVEATLTAQRSRPDRPTNFGQKLASAYQEREDRGYGIKSSANSPKAKDNDVAGDGET